ncbi:hypothetical protein M378DRAFT_12735 [Amanita muscaria Koide BX008]|uniref:Uncharacterized protein n=1 Tax=Amanita muscaria (strain Koide BX008) TaxID=946122 RepID=A0A0C2X1T9_AMAMK|nr:hypothetical protein M378DRAFT_12735 [Amanita muscaria Koide BX008]
MDITKDEVLTLSESFLFIFRFEIGDAYLGTVSRCTTSAHWGKLASDILTGNWEVALEELDTLRETIDSHVHPPPPFSPDLYFFTRATLMLGHSSLTPGYLNTNQTSCAWILRYLSAATVLSRTTSSSQTALGSPPVSSRVRTALREIVKVIQTEEYQYQDPKALNEAVDVVENAFFLGEFKGDILNDARYLISIRRLISDLSERLNLTRDEGEKWIVNLIRETHMGADAKIDLEKNVIEMNRPPQLVYQSVTEKTRGLALRTQTIGATVARAGVVLLGKQMQTQR